MVHDLIVRAYGMCEIQKIISVRINEDDNSNLKCI